MTASPKDEHAKRLAAALRENLKRRKAQARGRQATADAPPSPASHDRGGPDPEKPHKD
jgi:hypothetical protein